MLGLVQAPEINRNGVDWHNVDSPIKISDLYGRLGILAFWTSESSPSFSTLSLLKLIMNKFPDETFVVGINSPIPQGETASEPLAKTLDFHGITIPIAHDLNLELSSTYCINTFPSLVILDPEGRIVGTLPGEPDPDQLIPGISRMISDWQSAGIFTVGRA
jgi:hypothetical protein